MPHSTSSTTSSVSSSGPPSGELSDAAALRMATRMANAVAAAANSTTTPTNDQLAAQLMQCAILVKKGESGPLVRKTIRDLTDYLTTIASTAGGATTATIPPNGGGGVAGAARVPTAPRVAVASASAPAPPPPTSTGNLSTASSTTTSHSTLSKQTKAPFIAGLGKIMGLTDDSLPNRSHDSKAATSAKNAQRLRAEVVGGASPAAATTGAPSASNSATASPPGHHHPKHNWLGGEEPEWCDEHFTMGCACKTRGRAQPPPPSSTTTATVTASATAHSHSGSSSSAGVGGSGAALSPTTAASRSSKPAFQRPSNPQSSLIANGWIEQQRRSKMRFVWKDVLASLVEGRRRGEETTLWIQREVQPHPGAAPGSVKPKAELEALHQIPLKLVERVQYHPYSSEPKFSIKMYNNPEEYVFRCRDDESAQQWVLTLRSVQQALRAAKQPRPLTQAPVSPQKVTTGVDDWEQEAAAQRQQQEQGDIRRVVSEEEKKASDQASHPHPGAKVPYPSQHPQPPPPQPSAAAGPGPPHPQRATVTELRAIAHGAGINTHGMERSDLEAIVARIASPPPPSHAAAAAAAAPPPAPTGNAPSPPSASTGTAAPHQRDDDEVLRRRHQQQVEEAAAAARAVEAQKQQQRREEEERERQRMAQERQRRDEEEVQRKLAEKRAAEARRQQEEAQRAQQQQWQQQQQAWQKQQQEEEQRRRAAEQQAAEFRRQQEEAYRRQQQWQQSQAQPQEHQQSAPSPNPPQYPPGAPPYPQRPGYPPQQQPGGPSHPGFHHPGAGAPPPTSGGYPGPPPGPQAPPQGSSVNMKYAKMAQQSDDGAAIWNIKHGILIQWALLPPMLQVLRPIEDLLTSVHNVYPPKFGVPGHEYFTKWTAITYDEISQGPALGNRPDDGKLKKALRKLRFFLHPDKLPRDLTKEQTFICKMLWDVISDAEAEHKKKEEELGWIRG